MMRCLLEKVDTDFRGEKEKSPLQKIKSIATTDIDIPNEGVQGTIYPQYPSLGMYCLTDVITVVASQNY